ncbi:MAG TPA: hypothetical protein VKK79_19955, partial [Candidatus Lokiarchaeia archaeon]|nr:hypothetical protein [Candidatus Lokiarchaeia archaeon]
MGTISLNGPWLFCADELNIGVEHAWQSPEFETQNREQSMQVEVPHNWNLIPEMDRYEGVAWYFKEIPISDLGEIEGKECFLQFYGVNYDATAWLNGNKLGEHEGGFLPFRFAIPKKFLQPENLIAVRVENLRRPDRIPAMNFDWHNWGGIHRSVAILVQDSNRVNYAHVETIALAKARAILRVKYNVVGIISFTWQVIGEDGSLIEASGQEQPAGPKGDFQVEIQNPQAWDLGQPHLYTLVLMPEMSREEYRSRFGI